MSGRDGRYDSAFGRLGSAILIILVAGTIAFAVWQASQISRREVGAEPSNYHCKNADDCAAQQTQAGVQSALAAQDSVDLALWQLALNIAGIGGLAYTIYYARKAWIEAERSSNAAHEALVNSKRPNLLTNNVVVTGLRPDSTGAVSPHLLHRATNYGSGVAWVTKYATGIAVGKPGEEIDTRLSPERSRYWPIAPNAWYGSNNNIGDPIKLTKRTCSQIVSGNRELFVLGILEYRGYDTDVIYEHRFIYKYRTSDGTMEAYPHPFWLHTKDGQRR